MAALALRNEERIGLGLAVAAHIALVALILVQPKSRPVVPPPERMTVTLSDEVGLTSTSPEPAAQAAPDIAPELGEPAPPVPQPVVEPAPAPPPPRPEPRAVPSPRPAPRATPAPTRPRPQPRAEARPEPKARSAPPRSQPKARPAPEPPRKSAGGSRLGDDFLKGVSGADSSGQSRSRPAASIGPAVRSSLASAISRQLKPHWSAPQGADAELLVTLVRFRLARDGSLVGSPQVVGQSGVTPSNEAQKERHAEQAIRAVRLAAPFDLPDEYYSAWQTVTSRFDRRLSQ